MNTTTTTNNNMNVDIDSVGGSGGGTAGREGGGQRSRDGGRSLQSGGGGGGRGRGSGGGGRGSSKGRGGRGQSGKRGRGGRGQSGRGGGGRGQTRNVDAYGNELSLEEIHLARREVERLRGDVIALDQRIEDISTLRWQGEEQGQDTAMLTTMLVQLLHGKVRKDQEVEAAEEYFLSIKVVEVDME